ncbi:MAG: N-6 DNA methylase [Planctomycetaceae bacterium]|nr:N-6 DNA methylase [Planctomycetaceae bacterium]
MSSTCPARSQSAVSVRLLEGVARIREATRASKDERRAQLGQYFTPIPVARLMASLFETGHESISLLDPGAGTGVLTCAVVAMLLERDNPPKAIDAAVYELDRRLLAQLERSLELCRRACNDRGVRFEAVIHATDFITASSDDQRPLWTAANGKRFDWVIMNPPYRKIHGESHTRRVLRGADVETSNLYTAFLWLAARQLRDGGELVSINPRSFCNGPYFRNFRRSFLEAMSLRRVHVFESRSSLFESDDILQENVILHAVRKRQQDHQPIQVSCSLASGAVASRVVPYSQVIHRHDEEAVIHLTHDESDQQVVEQMDRFSATLTDLRLAVSTGPVVDFRARKYLRSKPESGTAPLIYPAHLRAGVVDWPRDRIRKPNAIFVAAETESMLLPSGHYVLVKRFSAKEERRRIVAAHFDPNRIDGERVAFENKTNFYHRAGRGVPRGLARGLTAYLNSTLVDRYFRQFSGHTQVNANDLRRLPYPDITQLDQLGRRCDDAFDQDRIDEALERLLYSRIKKSKGPSPLTAPSRRGRSAERSFCSMTR